MNTHAERPHTSPLSKLAGWVNAKWQARRARRMEEETLACLSALEPRLLNDIGVDIDKLSELARQNPHVRATKAVTPSSLSDRRRQW